MEYISHRVNTLEALKQVSREHGVELDLRDEHGEIIISHDPFVMGEKFEEYLKHYQHGTMILNIKSERIEHKVLELIKQYNIEKYFFLDSSFPMIYLLSNDGEKNIAIRYSEFEGMDTIRNMAGKLNWIWVDCFSYLPLDHTLYQEMKALGYKLCLVSPELQGRDQDIESYKNYCEEQGIIWDAICTKEYNVNRWK
ncbi:PI-PLC domain-containing protein [Fusibacter bizertensis]